VLVFVREKARKYAIVKELDEPVSLKDGTVVLQFETQLQEELEWGGANLKYLRPQEAGWKPKEFDNESPYTIMFGPDKCGATNKVHFISYLCTHVYSGNSVLHLLLRVSFCSVLIMGQDCRFSGESFLFDTCSLRRLNAMDVKFEARLSDDSPHDAKNKVLIPNCFTSGELGSIMV